MSLTIEEYEKLSPAMVVDHAGVRMAFVTPNVHTRFRVQSIYDKEPWTLEWIASFSPHETLFDIGANVGMYTIWAAATRGVRVFAFEPEAKNYAVLNRNIRANRLQDRVKAFCIGLSDRQSLTELHVSSDTVGGSGHAVGRPLNYKHKYFRPEFVQGCVSSKLDDLLAGGALPTPNHIKIDVDGFEPGVIAGARATLRNAAVKSVLVEINATLDDHKAAARELKNLGFRTDTEQVRRATRPDGPHKGIGEQLFRRS